MSLYTYAELISLCLTSSHIFLTVIVLVVFFPGLRVALGISRRKWRASQWLLVGVWLSHLGGFFDNSYWGAAWASSLKEMTVKSWMFKHGVFSNIPFRNILGIISTYCHLKGIYMMLFDEGEIKVKNMPERLLICSLFIGLFIGISVWMFL